MEKKEAIPVLVEGKGQKQLSVVLDEIEERANEATDCISSFIAFKKDVPRLVKALRRAETYIRVYGTLVSKEMVLTDLTAILNGEATEEEKSLGET